MMAEGGICANIFNVGRRVCRGDPRRGVELTVLPVGFAEAAVTGFTGFRWVHRPVRSQRSLKLV